MDKVEIKKFGFDVHGVLDDLPETFRVLNNALYNAGHEIHIITGSHITTEIIELLDNLGIKYTHIFGIADYHKKKGTKMWYDDNGTPWLDKDAWNETKGNYCREHGIHLHFDDTDVYNETFTTPFARVWSKNGGGNKPKNSVIK